MRLHRFFIGSDTALAHDFWLHDERLLNQWNKVLRFRSGQEVVLFDGEKHERLYKITELSKTEAHLVLITEFVRKMPKKEIYLLWSLLKKDKNDWVLQKCTELGVSHFVPLLSDRTEKTGFDVARAKRIVIEAAEQCGRSDIPSLREPISVTSAVKELSSKVSLYICEQDGESMSTVGNNIGIMIGPEGGWSDEEKEQFRVEKIEHLNLHDFTLRAETAVLAAVTMVGI